MDQERSEVREIDEARRRVADDVRSVAENANVAHRAKEQVQGRIEDAKGAVKDRVSDVQDRVSDVRDRVSNVRDNLQDRMQSMASNMPVNPMENPMGMLFAGLALGFLVGLLLPVSRFESERLGPMTDEMKDRVRQAGTEVVRRGGEVIKDTIEAARETATSSIREQGRDMGIES